MKLRLSVAAALLLLMGASAAAHRLDEYLQATTISLEKNRVRAELRLTPGVAVFSAVMAGMDADREGTLSAAEQRAYAERVLGDVSLTVNGVRLPLRLDSLKFPPVAEMKEGRGDIELKFSADAPHSGRDQKLVFENHHQKAISVYLVNCLVPTDPDIWVTAQKRNYEQSFYQLDFVQNDTRPALPFPMWRWASLAALLPIASFASLLRRGPRPPTE